MSWIRETTADDEDLRQHYIRLYEEKGRKKFGFYRPHNHKGYDNIDPTTGEVMPSMTKQSEMEACDIHNVLKQFSQQGFESLVREKAAQGQYADLPDDIDYQSALNLVIQAGNAFQSLPSQVRERFQNNPEKFLAFLQDPANQDEAIRLGLATDNRPPPKEPETPPTAPTGGEGGSPPSGGAKAP